MAAFSWLPAPYPVLTGTQNPLQKKKKSNGKKMQQYLGYTCLPVCI